VSAATVSLGATAGRGAEGVWKTTLRKAVILSKDRMNEESNWGVASFNSPWVKAATGPG